MGPEPDDGITFEVVDPSLDEAAAAIQAYFDELDASFDGGFDPGDATAADREHLTPPTGAFVLVRREGQVVGCGGVQSLGADGQHQVGEVKRMWIAPSARGSGLGRRLLDHLEQVARDLGHDVVRLDTNSVLARARALYASAGYVEIDAYNDNPYARHWYEKPL